jgi:protein tyrosine phosphatase (PTP) superfamily phosphohydrolase (DUF442 family)
MIKSSLSLSLALCMLLGAQDSSPKVAKLPESRPASEARYTKIGTIPGVQGVTKFSDRLMRGSQPQGVEGMESLKKLGVKTIISVEEPNQEELDAAKAAGLTVVNVPTEYNGLPDKVIQELLAAYRNLKGTAYVHCHHGKHRGGAAAAIYRMTYEGVSQLESTQEMAELGCSKRYGGLYETVRRYRPDPKTAHRVLEPRPGIDGLIEVTPWLYRGTSALNADSIAALKDLGITAIVSSGMNATAQERARSAGLAVTIVAIDPNKALAEPSQPIVQALAANKSEKVFLHATDDPAQVAAMVGAFRIAKGLWTPEEAAREVEALTGDRGAKLAESIRKGRAAL